MEARGLKIYKEIERFYEGSERNNKEQMLKETKNFCNRFNCKFELSFKELRQKGDEIEVWVLIEIPEIEDEYLELKLCRS